MIEEILEPEKKKELVPGKEPTRAKNNLAVIKGLIGIATLCILMSTAVFCLKIIDAKDIVQITFAPVSVIVGGLISFIKN